MPDGGVRNEAVELLRRLIACNTSNPPGQEAQAAAILEDYLAPCGLECERVVKDPARPNLLVRLAGRGGGPSLAFLGHLDVVQARRQDWSVEPFGGVERNGAIWGRGTVDMKSQVAATAVALATLAREGFEPNGDLMLIFMADEEVGEAGVGAPFFVEAKPDLRPDFVVGEGAGERYATAEGPIYLLDRGVNGSVHTTIRARGRAGDASLAHGTPNAAYELARLLGRLEQFEPEPRVVPEVEPLLRYRGSNDALDRIIASLTANVYTPTTVEASGPSNVVIEEATANIYGAVLPGDDEHDVEAELRRALGDGDYELDVGEAQEGTASPIDTTLYRAIESFIADRDPEARLVPALGYGYSDCQTLRKAYGSVAYGFIPFRHQDPAVNLTTKHGVDEHVLVDDLLFQVAAAQHIARTVGASQER
jgi:acetylornithine deacetylase/succinyl-diaminopimelate desuccinylase-like protein